jgi:hypothetical protein
MLATDIVPEVVAHRHESEAPAEMPGRIRELVEAMARFFSLVSIGWCGRSTWGWTHREAVRQTEETRMTTTLTTENTTPTTRAPYGKLLLVNLGATVAAGAAAEAWVAIMRAADVELRVGDPFGDASSAMALPTGACATSIAMCMVLGTALAVGLNWKARQPAHTYVVVTVALTLISLGGPLVAAGTSAGTKFTLIVAHLIAAAVIIPPVTRCLANRR